jgi:hypothetical protein
MEQTKFDKLTTGKTFLVVYLLIFVSGMCVVVGITHYQYNAEYAKVKAICAIKANEAACNAKIGKLYSNFPEAELTPRTEELRQVEMNAK